MRKINENTFIEQNETGKNIVKVIIGNIPYKSCSVCDTFFNCSNAKNTKYCPDCRRKQNIINTVERRRKKNQNLVNELQ